MTLKLIFDTSPLAFCGRPSWVRGTGRASLAWLWFELRFVR